MQRHLRLFAAATALFAQACAAVAGQAPASLPSATACSFQPPTPILLPSTYSGQSLERQSENRVTEKAQLDNGLRIEIRQSACVDFLTTEFTLIVPRGRNLQLDQNGWIELVRTAIAGLKTHRPSPRYAELNEFLRRAPGLRPHDGVLGICKDGSAARPGECSWESSGGFIFSVEHTSWGTRVSATQYLSG